MGVTYKLKDEIVEFIILQKKENPRLSCRGLVEIIQEKFQVPVSKSSINSVIKNASLSNPVGRTPLGEKKERKFQLPIQKKSILFPGAPLPEAPPSPSLAKPKPPLAPAKSAASPMSFEKPLYDGIGNILLKAAEWEISDKSILGNLLEDNLKAAQLMDLNLGCDVLLYLEMFGIRSLEEISHYHKQGLWILHGLQNRVNPAALERILQEVQDLKKLSLKISYEIPQIFTHIQAARFLLEDGSAVYVDAELTSLWPTSSIGCPACVSLNKAIDLISKQLLNNVQPCVFCSVPGLTSFSTEFYEMLAAFENVPGKRIKNISLMDIQQQELAQFDTIPHQRRYFIAGVWPWQKEFAELVSAGQGAAEKIATTPPFKPKIYYSEIEKPFPNNDNPLLLKLRAILLRESPGAAPYLALLTNADSGLCPANEVVATYISNWPNESKTPHLSFLQDRHRPEADLMQKDFGHLESNLFTLIYGIPGIWEIMHSLTSALNVFCQRHFFPLNYGNQDLEMMKEHFYDLNGHLWADQNFLFAKLVPPANYLYKKDLEYAMRRVNEKGICDPKGRRLIFQL